MRRIFTPKVLLVVAGIIMTGIQSVTAATKPSGGSTSGDLVISKVFYNNMMNDEGKAFILANYVELYNNSDKELDISGIYLGFSDNTAATAADYANAWTAANMAEAHSGMIALVQLFRIPDNQTLQPGQSVVICNSALNHTTTASKAPDLSGADFEVKSALSLYGSSHNDAVPELPQVFSYNSNSTYIQWMSPGPSGVVLLAADTNIDG
ncbi:MAG: lamin tail domain-containing protein, partial [Prevotella sp.]|nr:lamin tail domain-containing protein [Prevotella sp.]